MNAMSFSFEQLSNFNKKRPGALVGTIVEATDYLMLLLKMIDDKSYKYSISPELLTDSFFEACTDCASDWSDIDQRRLIAPELSLKNGAVLLWAGTVCRPVSSLKELSKMIGLDYEKPLIEQDNRFIDIVLHGYDKEQVSYMHKKKHFKGYYHGCAPDISFLIESKTTSKGNIRAIRFFSGQIDCPTCQGTKLNPETLNIKVHGKTILEKLKMPIFELQEFINELSASLNENQTNNLNELIDEINARLAYFKKIGLHTLMPHLDKTL